MIISLNGPMGIGKTTFTENLILNGYEKGGELRVFPKSVKWYYDNQAYFAFIVHSQFIIERILLEIEILSNQDIDNSIFDKHIADLYVYAEYSFSKGYLNNEELSALYLLYTKYSADLIKVNKILVLNSYENVLRSNLIKRGRDHEMSNAMLNFCIDFASKYNENFKIVAEKLSLKNVEYIFLEDNILEKNIQKIKKYI